jgi:hypothetical protein
VKRTLLIAVVGLGALAGSAAAQSLVPSAVPEEVPARPSPPEIPNPPPSPDPPDPLRPLPKARAHRPEPEALAPIPFFYRQLDRDRINSSDAVGRTNATRGEQVEQLTGWGNAPLGGGAM